MSALLAYLLCACAEPSPNERLMWLHEGLVQDNYRWLMSAPELVEAKLIKMAGRQLDGSQLLYPYLRGSLGQMYRDLAPRSPWAHPTLVELGDDLIWLVGDPHPENLSASLSADGELMGLGWDDMDSANFGPWLWDLRRLALSAWVIAEDHGWRAERDSLIEASVRGYLSGLEQSLLGARPRAALSESLSAEGQASELPTPVLLMLQKGWQRLRSRHSLQKYSELKGGQRALKRGELRPRTQRDVPRDELWSLTVEERALLSSLEPLLRAQRAAHSPPTPLGALKDVARRVGAGVSSYPAQRYLLLFEGPQAGVEDDALWELKELAPHFAVPQLESWLWRSFPSISARELSSRLTLGWRGADPSLLSLEVADLTFRARELRGELTGLNVSDLETPEDALAVLELTGSLLAGAHATAPSLKGYRGSSTGSRGAESILRSLRPLGVQEDPRVALPALLSETLELLERYGPQLRRDQAHLEALLTLNASLGGILGVRFTTSTQP